MNWLEFVFGTGLVVIGLFWVAPPACYLVMGFGALHVIGSFMYDPKDG
jgi:hypothetical protein